MAKKPLAIFFLCALIWKENSVEGKFKFSLKWESSEEPRGAFPVKNLPSINLLQNTNFSARNLPTFRNSVYEMGVDNYQGNFFGAQEYCRSLNMSLVSIESEDENYFLYQLMKERCKYREFD
uniref:Uncharacterized protein LOC114333684 n=1 Tax=Diabrotica virgifera virgifera TaxID=50390 RepID=A0A6P7G4C3_DIAVI